MLDGSVASPRKFPRDGRDYFLTILVCEESDKSKTCVVRRFIPDARLAKSVHFSEREEIVMKSPVSKNHVAVTVPEIECGPFIHKLSHPLGKPRRNSRSGNGI